MHFVCMQDDKDLFTIENYKSHDYSNMKGGYWKVFTVHTTDGRFFAFRFFEMKDEKKGMTFGVYRCGKILFNRWKITDDNGKEIKV